MDTDNVRHYAITLQAVLTVFGDLDTDWDGMEANIDDARSYTLIAPWETDVIAVIRGEA